MSEENYQDGERDDEAPLMDHNYDGIQELDHDMPAWWLGIFLFTILFALVYCFAYHGIGSGNMMEDEYKQAVKEHQMMVNAAEMDFDSLSDEQKYGVRLQKGASFFAKSCAMCHGTKAGGSVGPNLTDSAFLYGGSLEEMIDVITKGRMSKNGMMPAHSQFSTEEILSVATFVHSLKGTNVAGGKAAQGIEEK